MSSSCPFCHLTIPSPELEWHANNHLVEEEIARDLELAQQIALESPPRFLDEQVNEDNSFDLIPGGTLKTNASRYNGKINSHEKQYIQEKISCLVRLQIRSTFYKVECGLMALLRKCLELENENSTSILSSHVDHFQSIESEDAGWGCGWRNIQMLSSHLLMHRREAREVLFGGSGFVPDIPSLQRWLEIAWEKGFDILGSDSFNHKIYGSTKWIGTTECTTLFRSFGLQARMVDFGSKESESKFTYVDCANPGTRAVPINDRAKRKIEQVYGPMDKFLLSRHHGLPKEKSGENEKFSHCSHSGDELDASIQINNKLANHDEFDSCSTRKIKGHQVLVDWVWNYFAEKRFNRLGSPQHVIISDKTPLYFQHYGHSRTIVGIQVQQRRHGMPKRYSLLILDPAQRTKSLETSLRENAGWQRLIKRGVHTLKRPQYQLCYIDPGIAHGEELEQLKTIDSVYFES